MVYDHPKISVVLSSFNGAQFIEEQIISIIEQTIKPDEIIVCDDGSSDDTIHILKKFEASNQIKLFLNKSKLGILANFKLSASLANANNYIAFSDQDDIWLPNKLASNFEAMLKLEGNASNSAIPCLVYSDLTFMNEKGITLNHSFYNLMGLDKFEHCFETALFGSLLLGCTIFINAPMRHEFLSTPDSKLFYHDAWLSLLGFSIGKVYFINTPQIKYRLHNNNASLQKFTKRNRFLNVLNHIKKTLLNSGYLERELALAKEFKLKYQAQLNPDHQLILDSFLSLDHKYYFQKKWAFEKAFKNKWIKRF
jgi:glycosyltransferase involved in cell wall biosynthesis